MRRLESILTTAGILDGKIQNEPKWDESDTLSLKLEPRHANEGILSDSLHNEVYSILDYLEDFHGLSAIEEWFEQNPRQIAKERSYSEDYVAMELMGLEHIQKYANETRLMYPSFYTEDEGHNALLIDGFDYLYTFQLSRTQNLLTPETLINVGGDTMSLQMDYKLLHLSVRDQKIKLDLDSLYNTLKDNTDVRAFRESVPRERMTLELSNEYIKVRLLLTSLFSDEEGIQSCSGKLLIKWEQGK